MTKFDKLVTATLRKINESDEVDSSQFDPRLNKADVSNRPDHSAYKEPEDNLPVLRNQERNAGLDERGSKYSSLDYTFKNDIMERKGKILWVFSGPALGSSDSIFAKRKFKDITSLLSDPKVLEGQTFSGKFNDFKIVGIEPKEQQQRHEKIPNNFALYKAVPVK
jgi:hypothetical protein